MREAAKPAAERAANLPPFANSDGKTWRNLVFRAERLAPDHPGLIGRDLTPKGTLEKPRN